jgi:uncharacterized protein YggE
MYPYPFYKAAASKHSNRLPVIEVLGQGTVSASPDQAVVILGVVSEGLVLNEVQSKNASIVTNIINSLLDIKIQQEKIQTYDFRIEPQYDYQDGKQVFRGYKVTHLLKITTERVGQIGIIVDTAVAHGANTVSSIQFTMAKPEIYENQALSHAIHNARQKAETIAEALGVSLSAIPNHVEELTRTAEPIPYKTTLFAQSTITPIQPGELTINATVRVWYFFA